MFEHWCIIIDILQITNYFKLKFIKLLNEFFKSASVESKFSWHYFTLCICSTILSFIFPQCCVPCKRATHPNRDYDYCSTALSGNTSVSSLHNQSNPAMLMFELMNAGWHEKTLSFPHIKYVDQFNQMNKLKSDSLSSYLWRLLEPEGSC